MTKKHIGILVTGHAPDFFRADNAGYEKIFPSYLAGRNLEFTGWSVVDNQFPESIHDAEGWLITGSRHGAYEDHPWIPPLEDFIRNAYAAKVPIVGICFGHQIIAQALGGRVEKFKNGWAVGRQHYEFSNGLGDISLNAWHQDQVVEPPADATTIATNDFCRHAAFSYGDRAFSVQPHPEFSGEMMQKLLQKRGPGLVPDTLIENAMADVDAPVAGATLADAIEAFFLRER